MNSLVLEFYDQFSRIFEVFIRISAGISSFPVVLPKIFFSNSFVSSFTDFAFYTSNDSL